MSKRHTLKCWTENFQATWDGVQTYSIRKNDRDYGVGGSLQIEEFVPYSWDFIADKAIGAHYTGRIMGAEIIHITLADTLGLPSNICVLGLHIWKRQIV